MTAFPNIKGAFRALCLLILLSVFSFTAHAAESRVLVKGLVRDSLSGAAVPFAAVRLAGADAGGLTDENGVFSIYTSRPFKRFVVTAMGYEPKEYPAQKAGVLTVIELNPEGVALGEVTVGKRKYSKKNNPAVDFMQKIRRLGPETEPTRHPFYSRNKYERIRVGVNNFDTTAYRTTLKHLPFLLEHADTSVITGKPVLTLSAREKYSRVLDRASPRRHREQVEAIRSAGMDEIADAESMRRFVEDVLREIDLFDDDIPLVQNRFVSPLSRLAPDFYRFYLTDSVKIGPDSCIVLAFAPRNPRMFGFTGQLYVVQADTSMFVRRVDMQVPASINLNYVQTLRIRQEFMRAPDGTRLKLTDDLWLEAKVVPGAPEVFAERHTRLSDHSFEPPADADTIFGRLEAEYIVPEAAERDSLYWQQIFNKEEPSDVTPRMQQMMSRLRSNKVYYWGEKILKVLVAGYISTGRNSKVDIGPVNTFLSFNELEGCRLKGGLMTTANLMKRFFLKGFAAYGTRDHRWQFGAAAEWSLRPRKYHPNEFPIHSLAISYDQDINRLGEDFKFTNPDNIFLSISRHPDRMLNYHRLGRLRYTLELPSHFSIKADLSWERQMESRFIDFVDGHGVRFPHYDELSLGLTLRYAPGETFYQGRNHRYPINLDAPVVELSHRWGPRGLAASKFAVNRTELSVLKRFWFSSWGYLDGIVKGGHIWSVTPYPSLLIPAANPSYTVQPETFALLNPMEFAYDSYAAWDLTYWANGAIFNYIPLLNRLKLREVVAFRGVWGRLSNKNNPSLNPELFAFPEVGSTRMPRNMPYMELGVGIDNILTILRLDYVWRLSYLDTPGASNHGFQLALHFTF